MESTGATGIQRRILTAGGALTFRLHQLGASKGDRGPLQTDGKHHNYGDKPALHGANSNTIGCLSVRVPVMRVRIVRMCVLKRLVNMLMRMLDRLDSRATDYRVAEEPAEFCVNGEED